jgi:hypothetical protein
VRSNLKMIRLLMRGVAEKLHSHCHIKHFRSDLHRCIDFLLDEPRLRGFSHGLNEEHLSVQGLNPIASVPVPMETESVPSELKPTEKSMEDALPFADVDPKGDGTNYQTEIMVEIEKRSYQVIADLGATLSGVNLKAVRELDLVNSMLPTDYQYRTSSGHVEKALDTVSLALTIGPILITTPMVVMPVSVWLQYASWK